MPELFLLDAHEGLITSLEGFVRQHPWVSLSRDPLFLHHARAASARRVGIVSGGGSGHEPLHGGFLGPGMLDAAVPGKVFASPHNRQVYEASRAAARDDGVLHIVKNYTGDKINFGIAAERLAADGIPVARVLVDDDVATESDETATGRRGTAGAVVVEKILGAAADRGDGLASLAALGAEVAARTRSVAVASSALTSPHTGSRAFELLPDELEYGVGIHGERAATTIARPPLAALVARMLDDLLTSLPEGDDPLLLLVNGLGATTDLELCTVYELASRDLEVRGHLVATGLTGSLVVALDMSGFSLTVTQAGRGLARPVERPVPCTRLERWTTMTGNPLERLDSTVTRLREVVSAAEPMLTALDEASGDGDFGSNLDEGFARTAAIVAASADRRPWLALEEVFLDEVGGTSGPLLGLVFHSLGTAAASEESYLDALSVGLCGGSASRPASRRGRARRPYPGRRTVPRRRRSLRDTPRRRGDGSRRD